MNRILRDLVAPVLLCSTALAQAQIIEDIDVRREGADAIVQIRLSVPVQYRRTVASRSNDLTQAYYDVVAAGLNPSVLVTSERRLAPAMGLPQITVTDESVGRADLSRKLVVRFGSPTPSRVRAGQGDRVIELVLIGKGAGVTAALRPGSGQVATPGPSPAAAAAPVAATPAPEVAATPVAVPPSDAAAVPAPANAAEVEAAAARLLAEAKAGLAREDFALALDRLNQVLGLPPNAASREAQELAGRVRLKVGDYPQARAEFELFLKLYPTGADAERVREELARLPAPVAAAEPSAPAAPTTSTVSGSVSQFYYGGQSKVRTQEFQDSPIGGLPELVSDNSLSGTDQKQTVTSLDFNWRYRDTDSDMRFVFRDAWTANLLPDGRNKNRLSALYFDHRSIALGTSLRLGRQSPTGGGVLGRFDGVQAGYYLRPKWRLNAVAGVPVDTLLESKRHFYGGWIDAEALTPELSASVYGNQQMIDGRIDRRALGTEVRYFSGGVSASAIFDYDTVIKGLNIASVQATWIGEAGDTVNALYDRRATPMLMLGNALFFQDPTKPLVQRLKDLLGSTTLEALRRQVKAINSYTTQALLGVTHPVTPNWQVGGDLRLTNVGAIAPVPDILPQGAKSTGNLWSLGGQVIGTNLYSERDTHVFSVTVLTGPQYSGKLFSYNNSSQVAQVWQLEPSFRVYLQNDDSGLKTTRWAPGLRVSWRAGKQATLESEVSYERSKLSSPTTNENSNRVFYYLGGRYDF